MELFATTARVDGWATIDLIGSDASIRWDQRMTGGAHLSCNMRKDDQAFILVSIIRMGWRGHVVVLGGGRVKNVNGVELRG